MHRRQVLRALLLGSAVVLGLTGCSPATPTIPGLSSEATRVVVDVEGTKVEVPEQPQKIIALSEPTLDGLLAIGITPAGAVSGRGQSTVGPYLKDRAEGIELLGSVSQPNFEAIGNVQPDLILVDGTSINNNPPIIEALRQIAPVVYTGYAGGDWRANLRQVASAVNRVDDGERVIAEYESRASELKSRLVSYSDQTFSIVRWQGNSAALILKELPAGRALTDVGLRRPPEQDRNGRGHSDPVSAENLQSIDANYIFFGTLGGSSVTNPNAGGDADQHSAQEAITQAEDVAGFTDLTAYRENHILPVDGAAWTSTGGPLLMHSILDDIDAYLT